MVVVRGFVIAAPCVVVALAIACAPCFAQTKVYGLGNASCGSYIEARAGRGAVRTENFTTWLTGYLTGVVQQTPSLDKKVAAADTDAYAVWLDNYCRQNPTSSYYAASYSY